MNWWAVRTAESLVAEYGFVALFVVFLFEGALIGKLIPTRTLFLGVVVLVGTPSGILSAFAAAVSGATLGQYLLFCAIRRRDLDRDAVARRARLNDRWVRRSSRWFDRWGLPALLVSNTLPIVRGYLVVPVALSSVSGYKFSIASLVGTILYVGALCLIAVGIETAASAV